MSGSPRGHLHCGRLALKDGMCRNRVDALGPDPATPLHPCTFPSAPTAQQGEDVCSQCSGETGTSWGIRAWSCTPGTGTAARPQPWAVQLPASVTSPFCPTTPGVKGLSPACWPGDGSRGTRTAVAMGSVVNAILPPLLISPGCKWGDVGWAEALVTVGMGQPGGQGSHRDQTLLLGLISPGCGCPCHLSSQSLHHWLTLSPGWWPPWDAQLYLNPPALQRLCCGTPGRGGPGTSACPSPRLVLPPAPHARPQAKPCAKPSGWSCSLCVPMSHANLLPHPGTPHSPPHFWPPVGAWPQGRGPGLGWGQALQHPLRASIQAGVLTPTCPLHHWPHGCWGARKGLGWPQGHVPIAAASSHRRLAERGGDSLPRREDGPVFFHETREKACCCLFSPVPKGWRWWPQGASPLETCSEASVWWLQVPKELPPFPVSPAISLPEGWQILSPRPTAMPPGCHRDSQTQMLLAADRLGVAGSDPSPHSVHRRDLPAVPPGLGKDAPATAAPCPSP